MRIETLSVADAWLRHHLVFGQRDSAAALLDTPEIVEDELLRSLQDALVARAAGDFERSNDRLEVAERIAERRSVRSASEAVGSFLLSDRVSGYTPTRAERSLIPFYRMMNHLALADVDGAAVEARRITTLLDGGSFSGTACDLEVTLRHLAGLVFEKAGEPNDALVALRRAEAARAACEDADEGRADRGLGRDIVRVASALGLREIADSAAARHRVTASDTVAGEVLLVLERGFIAHLKADAVHVPIFEEELEDLESGDGEEIAKVAALAAARLTESFVDRARWGRSWNDEPAVRFAYILGRAHVVRFSWPSAVIPERSSSGWVVVSDERRVPLVTAADLSATVPRELATTRAGALARTIARGIVRFLLARELEEAAEERGGEALGFFAGRLANIAGNELERADIRSWSLLPDEILIARMEAPPGGRRLRIEIRGQNGEPVVADLGEVTMTGDGVAIVSHRAWTIGTDALDRDVPAVVGPPHPDIGESLPSL